MSLAHGRLITFTCASPPSPSPPSITTHISFPVVRTGSSTLSKVEIAFGDIGLSDLDSKPWASLYPSLGLSLLHQDTEELN